MCNLFVLTYRKENWNLMKALKRKLHSAQKIMQRIMVEMTWIRKKTSLGIRVQTKVEDLLTTINRKMWTWAGQGHFIRQSDNIWSVGVTKWQPKDDRRMLSWHRRRWRDDILSFAVITWNMQATDIDEWKRFWDALVLQWTHRDWWK